MPYALVTPVYDPKMRGLCTRPYLGHLAGCPNFRKKKGCPPDAQLLPHAFDLTQPCYVIWAVFPFGEHVAAMRKRHPDWSARQAACCLYWQGKARKGLSHEIGLFLASHLTYRVERCPEAMGLNVTETMKQAGVTLEWPPSQYTTHVAFAGVERA